MVLPRHAYKITVECAIQPALCMKPNQPHHPRSPSSHLYSVLAPAHSRKELSQESTGPTTYSSASMRSSVARISA